MSATGSNAYIAIVKASTGSPGETPPSPTMQIVNFTDSNLGAQVKSEESKNISGSRRTTDTSITGFTVGGGYNYEMTYENSLNDELIEGFLWGKWSADTPQVGTSQIKDSDSPTPFFIERGHTDISEYFHYKGMYCNIWKLAFKDQAVVTGGYEFSGLSTESSQTPVAGSTLTPATTNPTFSTVTNIPEIVIDGVQVVNCYVKEWDLEINNNLTPKTGVGKLGACSINAHKFSVKGNITLYFEDSTMYDRLFNGTPFSFQWTMADNLGNTYKFILPKLKLETDESPIPGEEDVMENITFIAIEDPTTEASIIIEKTSI